MKWRRGFFFLTRCFAWAVVSILLWDGCFALNALHTDFPSIYHPDEGGKIEQLLSGERNYNHPQLMLEAALWIMPPDAQRMDPDALLIHERTISAMFVASAVVLLAWAGAAAAGPFGFFAVAITAGLCPPLIEAGHYLKEDASLVFGMACVLCAGAGFARTRRAVSIFIMAILLGAAAGVAASGKYCGVAFLVLALILVIVHLWRRSFWLGGISVLLLVSAAGATWAGINYRAIDHWDDFTQVFRQETEHSTTGHRGVALMQPNTYFVDVARNECPLPILLLACAAPFAWLLQRRPTLFGPWVVVSIAGYLFMLAYSAIPFPRYALPATVMMYVLAGPGLVWITRLDFLSIRLPRFHMRKKDADQPAESSEDSLEASGALPRRGRRLTVIARRLAQLPSPTIGTVFCVVGLGALTIFLGFRAADVNHQFGDDSRDALREWVRTLPPGTKIAADDYAELRGPYGGAPLLQTPAHIYSRSWAADLGSILFMQRVGIEYVVAVSSSTDRFFNAYAHGEPGDEAWFLHQRQFYENLAAHYPIAWQRVATHPMHEFVNPDIRVYKITPAAKGKSRR